ncbi:Na/Pi cotransporter family protein [Phosphitispora fastidiosa]|uniref:Na/Pi cotransporter family protein n=1 Tax=Phosphitispora fastidiosa TaxID=2837202 RepID=UPI001E4A3075|nr:Na/Pi cotransporter family protein [Phosphitispora fastidiosa]MBU7005684.1 phosphate:Na+ symporter [Phosphitispora fastidiosa]
MLSLLNFFAGIALLLFGMRFMRDGLESAARRRMQEALKTLTRNPLTGFITGTVITALVQSSTAVTVITIGFVNAGILTFSQAVGIVLGTNVGTCITTQIISFRIENIALPAIGLGALLIVVPRKKSLRCLGQSITGFGIIFLGINTISDALEPLKNSPHFVDLLAQVSSNAFFGVVAGTFFTALIHSSATTTGIVITLSRQGLVDLPTSIAIILGSNIGTCITGVLAAIGTPPAAKQVAAAHVLLNVVGAIAVIPFILPFAHLVETTATALPRQIANAHTIFNVLSSLLVLPFTQYFTKLVKKLIPD